MIIKQLADTEGVSATSIRHFYNDLERIIFDRLSSTTPTDNTVVKLFEGISINCNYNEAKECKHPNTGAMIITPAKIWANASITRNYNRKLNKST